MILRSDELSIHQLTPGGRLVAKGFLAGASEEKDRFVDAAALSPAGDVWVVFGPPNQLEVFRTGKSVLRLECSWVVSAVAAAPEGPIVAVLPAELDSPTAASYRTPIPPLLERWDGKRWETLVEGVIGPDRATTGASHLEFLNGFSSLMTLSTNGHLWVADKNAARLRHFSALAELKEEIRIGPGEVEWAQRTPEDFERMEKVAQGSGFKFDRRTVSAVQATSVYRAIVEGRDGLVYLLAETRDGLALDRFDPKLPSYDRVLLTKLELPLGRITLAAGAHSLLIGARLARDGIWEIPNEVLDEADWRQVPEATVNGTPIPERKAEPPAPQPTRKPL